MNSLKKEVAAALPAEALEDVDMPAENDQSEDVAMPPETEEEKREREEIEKKIAHIHRSTGHGSMDNLVQALQCRGAREKFFKLQETEMSYLPKISTKRSKRICYLGTCTTKMGTNTG